jgi:hypothetical protein
LEKQLQKFGQLAAPKNLAEKFAAKIFKKIWNPGFYLIIKLLNK